MQIAVENRPDRAAAPASLLTSKPDRMHRSARGADLTSTPMNLESFNALPTKQVAEIVRSRGPRIVVFPINGTRRWYLLEHAGSDGETGRFLDRILDRYIALFDLLFSHGIHTLLTPVLGPDIAARGGRYRANVRDALHEITGSTRFKDFYDRREVRVRFYGAYRSFIDRHFPGILERMDAAAAETARAAGHRLFWGMFAHDAVETTGRIAVEHHRRTGELPDRETIVTAYYGERVPPADLYIGMLPPRVFDFPLLDTGSTALYFTTAPSPYLDEPLLRRILHDYLYNQPEEAGYEEIEPGDLQRLQDFYHANAGIVTGTGRLAAGGRIWLPD